MWQKLFFTLYVSNGVRLFAFALVDCIFLLVQMTHKSTWWRYLWGWNEMITLKTMFLCFPWSLSSKRQPFFNFRQMNWSLFYRVDAPGHPTVSDYIRVCLWNKWTVISQQQSVGYCFLNFWGSSAAVCLEMGPELNWRSEWYAGRGKRRSVDEAVGPIIERT